MDCLGELTLPDDYIVISLDVVSLFANIEKYLTVSIIKEKWGTISAYTDIPKTLPYDGRTHL